VALCTGCEKLSAQKFTFKSRIQQTVGPFPKSKYAALWSEGISETDIDKDLVS